MSQHGRMGVFLPVCRKFNAIPGGISSRRRRWRATIQTLDSRFRGNDVNCNVRTPQKALLNMSARGPLLLPLRAPGNSRNVFPPEPITRFKDRQ
jgi:hypothetical protein